MGSLVGAQGALNVTAGATANTPAWGTGESRTTGNLGILYIAGTASTATVGIPTVTGWTPGPGVGVATNGAWIFYRALTGADTAPTVPSATNVSWKCSLAEYTGVLTTSDKTGSTSTGTTSATAVASGVDAAAGELVAAVASWHGTTGTLASDTFAFTNNGTPTITEINNNSTSAAHHTSQGFTFGTTSNASADSVQYTPSTTATSLVVAIASFQLTVSTIILPHNPNVIDVAVNHSLTW